MDRDVGKRTRKDQNIRIRRYNKVKPEACVAVDIRMEEYVMYEPTADRKGGEGAKDIDSRPVAAEEEPNRRQKWGWMSVVFFYLSSAGLQHKRKEEERMMERKCEEVLDLS